VQELQSGVLLTEILRKPSSARTTTILPIRVPSPITRVTMSHCGHGSTIVIDHREVVLSIVGGIPTVYTLLYAWYQRRRVTRLMAQIAALKIRGATDRATIENIRMHALTLVAKENSTAIVMRPSMTLLRRIYSWRLYRPSLRLLRTVNRKTP